MYEEIRSPQRHSTCRIQNPDIPRAVRGGVAHGGVAGRSRIRQNGMPTDRFAQETNDHLASQGIEDHCPELLFGSTNTRNSCHSVDRRRAPICYGWHNRRIDARLRPALAGITGSSKYALLHQVAQLVRPAGLASCRLRVLIAIFCTSKSCGCASGPFCPHGTWLAHWHTAADRGIFCLRITSRSVAPVTLFHFHGDTMADPTNLDNIRNPFSLFLSRLLGKISCRSNLRRPKAASASTYNRSFQKTGTRTSDIRTFFRPRVLRTYFVLCWFSPSSFSKSSPWKISCGSNLRRPHAASASTQDVLPEKSIPRRTFTNRPCRPDLASGRALHFSNSTRCSVCWGKLRLPVFLCLSLSCNVYRLWR